MDGNFSELLSFPHTDAEGKWLRERLETLSVKESAVLTALLSWKEPKTAADAVNLLLNVSRCAVYSPVSNCADLGERYLKEEGVTLPTARRSLPIWRRWGVSAKRNSPDSLLATATFSIPDAL